MAGWAPLKARHRRRMPRTDHRPARRRTRGVRTALEAICSRLRLFTRGSGASPSRTRARLARSFLQLFDSGGSLLEQFLGQRLFPRRRPSAPPCRQRITEQSGQRASRPVSDCLARNRNRRVCKTRRLPRLWSGVKTDIGRTNCPCPGGCPLDYGHRAGNGATRAIESRVGNRARGAGAFVSAAPPPGAGSRLLRAMPASARSRGRLLRFSGTSRRQPGNRGGRRIRQGCGCGAHDGEPRSVAARPGSGCPGSGRSDGESQQPRFQASAANRYATLFYAQYDPATRQLCYVNAGHNPPMVLRNSAGSCQVLRLETGGPVVGLLPQNISEVSCLLSPET